MSHNEARKAEISESIRKRQEQNIITKKINLEQYSLTQNVIKDIDDQQDNLHAQIRNAKKCELKGVELNNYLDQIANNLRKFEKHLSEYSTIVPRFELRKAQENVKEMRETFQEIQSDLQPKKKFGFNKLKKVSNKKTEFEPKSEKIAPTLPKLEDESKSFFGCVIKDKCDTEITIKELHVEKKDVLITNLRNCTIRAIGTPSTLHLTNLDSCTILSGPVSTSVFVEKCQDCHFVIACQQLRAHETENSSFYLLVTSRAIIEDCSQIRFGPYDLTYLNIDSHFHESGLDRSQGTHEKVDDFNWLASDKASPNFCFMSPNELKSYQI